MGTNMDSKLKITVLYESWGNEEEEVAPEPEKKKRGVKKRRKKREKHDREEIFEALEKLGHEPSYMMLDGEDKSLLAQARQDFIWRRTRAWPKNYFSFTTSARHTLPPATRANWTTRRKFPFP